MILIVIIRYIKYVEIKLNVIIKTQLKNIVKSTMKILYLLNSQIYLKSNFHNLVIWMTQSYLDLKKGD
jgi:hypothetical protein